MSLYDLFLSTSSSINFTYPISQNFELEPFIENTAFLAPKSQIIFSNVSNFLMMNATSDPLVKENQWNTKGESIMENIGQNVNLDFVDEIFKTDEKYKWNMTYGNASNMNETLEFSMFSNRPHWQNILDKVVTYIMMFNVLNVMLGMGSAIYLKQVIKSIWPPFGIVIGMCGQFILIPLLGFGLSVLFKLKPYEALGCLVISCCPGGTFSNFYTYWLEGDLALSIVMTGCSSILAFVGMPLNLWIYTSYYVGDESSKIVIPYLNILRSLAFIGAPVIVGMVIRHFFKKAARIIVKMSSMVAFVSFLIVMVSWTILYYRIFLTATPYIFISAISLPLLGFSGAYLVAFLLRRPHKICRTIGVETGSQNMPIAASIILLSFDQPDVRAKMLLFPTLYGVFLILEMVIAIVTFKLVKKKLNKDKESKKNKMALAAPLQDIRKENGIASERETMIVKD